MAWGEPALHLEMQLLQLQLLRLLQVPGWQGRGPAHRADPSLRLDDPANGCLSFAGLLR